MAIKNPEPVFWPESTATCIPPPVITSPLMAPVLMEHRAGAAMYLCVAGIPADG